MILTHCSYGLQEYTQPLGCVCGMFRLVASTGDIRKPTFQPDLTFWQTLAIHIILSIYLAALKYDINIVGEES